MGDPPHQPGCWPATAVWGMFAALIVFGLAANGRMLAESLVAIAFGAALLALPACVLHAEAISAGNAAIVAAQPVSCRIQRRAGTERGRGDADRITRGPVLED